MRKALIAVRLIGIKRKLECLLAHIAALQLIRMQRYAAVVMHQLMPLRIRLAMLN